MIIIVFLLTMILAEFGFIAMAVLGDIYDIMSMIVIGSTLSIANFVILTLMIVYIICQEY